MHSPINEIVDDKQTTYNHTYLDTLYLWTVFTHEEIDS
jgi:hypothetical protein